MGLRAKTVTLAVMLAGCGSDDGGSGDSNGSAETGTMTTSPSSSESTPTTSMSTTNGTSTSGATDDTSTTGTGTDTDTGGTGAKGNLIVDPDYPHWLKYEGDGPFFMCGPGDPEDFLYRGSINADGTRDGDQDALITKLAPTGANAIYFQIVRSHGGDGESTHNPFVDFDPQNGLNDAVLDQWDGWFSDMNDAGIVVFLFFYDDSASIWGGGNTVGPEEQAFIETIVDRFEHHPLLIWIVAEEYSEAFSTERASDIAGIIKANDDMNHPVAVHQLTGLDFDFKDDPNVDQFAIQHNVGTASELHAGMVSIYGDAVDRYNLNMSESAMHGAGAVARAKNWASAMGGAYVMILGQDIASTPVADLEDCGWLVQFFEATRFNEMAPHDELAFADAQYVFANPPDGYIVYAENAAGPVGVMGVTAGTYDLHWLNPADGTTVDELGVAVADGDQSWPLPGGIGPEVALSIERQ